MFTEERTPAQHLGCCLAAIRGRAVSIEQIQWDMVAWINEHGPITRESVDQWAANSELLKRAIERMVREPVTQ